MRETVTPVRWLNSSVGALIPVIGKGNSDVGAIFTGFSTSQCIAQLTVVCGHVRIVILDGLLRLCH